MAFKAISLGNNPNQNDHGHPSYFKYHRLHTGRQPCGLRLRRVKGKTVLLLRLLQSKKRKQLRLLNFIIMLPTRVIAFYTEIIRKLISLDSAPYPTIGFSSQWGMPVLSHPSAGCRRRVMMSYQLDRGDYY